jgi:hypothetical protein
MDKMPDGIPEWVYWIGAGIGSMLAGLVIRLGWKSAASGRHMSETAEVSGALVDSASVKMLAAAIEAHTLELITARKVREKTHEDGVKTLAALREEIQELRREMRYTVDRFKS